MRWYLPAILLFGAFLALTPSLLGAQEPAIRVSNAGPGPLLVDGVTVTRFPATVRKGSEVCIVTDPSPISELERHKFKEWSHWPTDQCVFLTEPGDYSAIYQQELLFTIRSRVKEFLDSSWVPKGVPVNLSVPELVNESKGVRYFFEEWSGGESPFSPNNSITPNRPLTLEVRWTKEYFLELQGPEGVRLVGHGWHKEGENVTMKGDETAFVEDNQRFQIRQWEVISNPAIIIPNRQQASTTIRIDNPHTIQAVYEVAYRVTVDNPDGNLKREWIAARDTVRVETSEIIERSANQERLVFKGWEGTDLALPSGVVEVTEPLNLKALYDREYFIRVESQYGADGDGWYKDGDTAIITVPKNPDAIFFVNKSFNGFDGLATDGPSLEILVTGPKTVVATYSTSINVQILVYAIVILAVLGVAYLFTQREYNRRRRRSRW